MDGHPPKIRGIVEQDRLADEFISLRVSARKIDDLIKGLGDTIARKPEVFARESITGWSRIIGKAFRPTSRSYAFGSLMMMTVYTLSTSRLSIR